MKNSSGFTIVELMTAILIGGVLMAIAIPNYTAMVQNNCLTSKTNAIVASLQLARSTAITRRTDITVAALCLMDANDDDTADGACSNTDEFGSGMVIFQNLDGDAGLADTAEIVKTVNFTCPATIDETSNTTSFIYSSNGAILPTATFNVCDERACADANGRQVTLSATGRPSTNSHFTLP